MISPLLVYEMNVSTLMTAALIRFPMKMLFRWTVIVRVREKYFAGD